VPLCHGHGWGQSLNRPTVAMRVLLLLTACAALLRHAHAQSTESDESTLDTASSSNTRSGTETDDDQDGPTAPIASFSATSKLDFYTGTKTQRVDDATAIPTGPYQTYSGRITLGNPETETPTSGSYTMSYTPTVTITNNVTATTTVRPTNTQPCNNYVELCTRKYSNITNVGCHNSPFVRPGNSGSNQELPVKQQLDDGVRFIQAQIQFPEGSNIPHFCHSTCDLLDAGPITEWLGEVTDWVEAHPYDVVTILLGNGNYSQPSLYAPYIQRTGILKYTYEAPYLPMRLDDWPTLENLILRGKRVIMFMDYNANQQEYPWLLDQFAQMWESPFDPQDRDFPCTVQRPPNLSEEDAKDRLYLVNHNLNVEFNVFGASLLVPAVSLLNETNSATGYGSLGVTANQCREDWGRAPNILNVDYYNYGDPPGSVFEVAAEMNNVTYDRPCCGVEQGSASSPLVIGMSSWLALVALHSVLLF